MRPTRSASLDPIVGCWGAAGCWPLLDATPDGVYFAGDEEYLQWTIDQDKIREENNQRISEVLALKALVTINQLMPVSLTEWLGTDNWVVRHGFSESIKAALLYEVEQVLQERDRARRESEQKRKMDQLAAAPATVALPHNLGGIQNYLK